MMFGKGEWQVEDAGNSDAILESLLHMVDHAREEDAGLLSLKAGEIADEAGLSEPAVIPTICRILESRWFEEYAGAKLVHRIGVRGRPDTIYLFDVAGYLPNRASLAPWRRLNWWWMQTSSLERVVLLLASLAMLLALFSVWWVVGSRAETGWPLS